MLFVIESISSSGTPALCFSIISKIVVKTKGNVRRAKLYYLKKLTGRKAKITEDRNNLKDIVKKKEEKIMSRSVWKGPFVDPSLIKKVEKSNKIIE